jgi:thiamine-monophosphate kinase
MTREERRIGIVKSLLIRYPAHSGTGLQARVGVDGLDDCAVLPISPDLDLIIGSDFVRGEGFLLYKKGLLTRQEIGYYLVGANASDLAAMGATPMGITVVYRYVESNTDREFADIMEGVTTACKQFSLPLLGGDTGTYELPVLAATAFGTCLPGKALLRSRGCADDLLFVTGSVGTAGAAYRYFRQQDDQQIPISADLRAELLQPWKRVQPAISQGRFLAESGYAKCAIDTSDGLRTACRQLAISSHLDIVLDRDAIPIAPATKQLALLWNVDEIALACGDSVDFRLLFSATRNNVSAIRQHFDVNEWELFQIGYFRAPSAEPSVFLRAGGSCVPLPGEEKDM